MDLFEREFNTPEYTLIITYSKGDYYLARENKETGHIDWFHRWLMSKEVDDFCIRNNCKVDNVKVHHIYRNTWDNRKAHLKVMTKKEHDRIHGRDK